MDRRNVERLKMAKQSDSEKTDGSAGETKNCGRRKEPLWIANLFEVEPKNEVADVNFA